MQTRSQWYRQKIDDFLQSEDELLFLKLYPSEKRYVEKYYPVGISIVHSIDHHGDQRISCKITKQES